MSTLSEFLLTRIAEDEEVARGANWRFSVPSETPESAATHIARWDPARVLAECDAKRRIVEAYVDMQALGGTERIEQRQTLRWTIELFAVAYVDHPDYREEWKP